MLLTYLTEIDGLDAVIAETQTVLSVYLGSLAILLVFVVVGECVSRFKRRSPVEKLLRRRFG